MNSKPETISVGILGFGDRSPAYDRLARIIKEKQVVNITILWNQPSESVRLSLTDTKKTSPKLTVLFSDENTGSAGGYASLVREFRDIQEADHLFLLDDDLLLEQNCIENLLAASSTHASELDRTIFSAYRKNLPEMRELVDSKIGFSQPRNSCCVAFHLFNIFKQHRESVQISAESGLFVIGTAPWGGLFIPRRALTMLGLPNENFFLYAEDSELTHRFTRSGGKILLVPDAEVEDMEPAWNTVGGNMSNLKRRILHLPDIKVFHEVRNRNYIARHYYPGNTLMYMLNKGFFLLSAYLIGLANGKLSRARLIHQAINEGEKMAAKEARAE